MVPGGSLKTEFEDDPWLTRDDFADLEEQPLTDDIAELYATRSVLEVRVERMWPATETFWGTWNTERFGFVLYTPFGIVLDAVALPFRLAQHATVSEEQIINACEDIDRARELGYTEARFEPGCPHIDKSRFYLPPERR